LAAAKRYCSAIVKLFSGPKMRWAWRLGATDARARARMASDFVNEIIGLRPVFREGRMKVILGLRCRVR
jgi:hypothetical protein